MTAGRNQRDPRYNRKDIRVVPDRPQSAGYITFGEAAERLLDNGYEPLPIVPGEKRPAPSRWTSVDLTPECIGNWCEKYREHGVGLRTGRLVGLDIDDLDPDRAHAAQVLAEQRFGATLVRVGQWPKRLMIYRAEQSFQKLKVGKIEILGSGQQFVAFGRHKVTEQPYYWTTGETPLDVDLGDLPILDQESAAAFLAEIAPSISPSVNTRHHRHRSTGKGLDGPVRNAQGLVVDGRDAWLSQIAFHAIHDAIADGAPIEFERTADQVWARFRDSTDLTRAKQDGSQPYAPSDANKKLNDKLRLVQDGRLPDRDTELPEPGFDAPTLSISDARTELASLFAGFCEQVQAWMSNTVEQPPCLGIRATVGIGKSRVAREQLLALAATLRKQGLPHRILVFTASHALAEETAQAWQAEGALVAVLRGYERKDPATGEPMCRDLDAVRAALSGGLNVRKTVCDDRQGATCRFFHSCHKQRNLRDVAAADVVIAPYDALFSGLAFERDDVALLLIDEGCWARAVEQKAGVYIEDIPNEPIAGMGTDRIGRGPVGAMADLMAFRSQVVGALTANGPGPVGRANLRKAGLSAEACRCAAGLERWRLSEPGLVPGAASGARTQAIRIAADNARITLLASLWEAMGRCLDHGSAQSGQLRIKQTDASGRHEIILRRVRRLHDSLRNKPVLHLDATMRAELVRTILPSLEMKQIDVAAPHTDVRFVSGSFGKSMLCSENGLTPEEASRRANRLQECVDYVRWHARRQSPGRVLVVTYKSIEAAFAGIPNVDTAHFNAVAGLDAFKNVAGLISIGRPLPSSHELEALTGAYFEHVSKGRYRRELSGIRMSTGLVRGMAVLRHEDELTETLRAAICDDELIQVVGRGRGVNRTADNPLEVHVLADVALPLVCNRLSPWDLERPDFVQKMLLAGIAVDSPTDAVALHPELFANAEQAKKALGRGAFKGQTPMNTSYREMSLKSAAYRRAGRGRGWQRVWWIDGDGSSIRDRLEVALGALTEWRLELSV